jgi:hypothetical protein
MTELVLRINNTMDDVLYVGNHSKFVDVEDEVDTFIFSNETDQVKDGMSPGEIDLNRAATTLNDSYAVDVSKYFILKSRVLKEAKLAGNQNFQHAFCCSISGATATEPILEAWDDNNINTILLPCLGAGNPNISWYKAVCTTNGAPGDPWVGTVSLGGSGSSNHLPLNDGVIPTEAIDLYFNFKIRIPAQVFLPSVYSPILLVTFCTN